MAMHGMNAWSSLWIMPEPSASASVPGEPTLARPDGQAATSASWLRQAILVRLRQSGPASPDELAASLGASRTGVLQQLRTLEGANLVRHETERHGVGRPRHRYDVTPAAQKLFPSNYSGLAAGLLQAIQSVGGHELLDRVLTAHRRRVSARVQNVLDERLAVDAPLADRVRALAVIQDEQGYLSDVELAPDGTIRMHQRNCAVFQVASGEPAVCAAELALFRDVLGHDVIRETHIISGDRCCTFRIGASD
jgi:predicted ArsR family transcriptional regulator